MKNYIEIEGYVTNRVWHWTEPDRAMPDTLFRLACYPEEQTQNNGRKPHPFYVTIRVPGSILNGIPVGVCPEQRLLVTGRLVSRDYVHTLTDFLVRAKSDLALPEGVNPVLVTELRSLNEVIADSIRVVEEPGKKTAAHPIITPSRRQRQREQMANRSAAQPVKQPAALPIVEQPVQVQTTEELLPENLV